MLPGHTGQEGSSEVEASRFLHDLGVSSLEAEAGGLPQAQGHLSLGTEIPLAKPKLPNLHVAQEMPGYW